jgi:Protein kinase domain/PASTA domain
VASVTLTGAELAGYRIEAVAGRGGMGVVYRAWHLGLERPVALKVISPGLASQDEFRARFRRESRLAAALDHPHVLPIYEAGESDGVLFIAMRWVDGIDLGRVLDQDGALPLGRAVRLVAQVAGALDCAHSRGLVHRDVKPANVLGADSDHGYLADFGLAKREDTAGLTETGRWLGTADYAAPEQIEGGEVGPAADVYALGCVLFAALTGEPPFPRESAVAVAYAQVHDPAPAAGVSMAMDAVLARALAKRPADRFASAGELSAAATVAVAAGENRAARAWTLPPTGGATVPLRDEREAPENPLATHPLRDEPTAGEQPGPTDRKAAHPLDALATHPLPPDREAADALAARPLSAGDAGDAMPPRRPGRSGGSAGRAPRRRGRRALAALAALLLLGTAATAVAIAVGVLHLPSLARPGQADAIVPPADGSGATVRCAAGRCHQGTAVVRAPADGSTCARGGRPGTWTRIDADGHDPMLACVLDATDPPLAAVHPRVPDLAGARLDLAERMLDRSGIPYDTDGGGLLGVVLPQNWTVCSTDPGPGTTLPTDTAVTLAVDDGC